VSAVIAAIGGAMFTLQVGFMSPSFVGIVPSIEMVIFAAVGGRMSLIGVVYGTLLVNFGKTGFSETFPEMWLFLMGGLFIAVVMFFPNGLAGIWNKYAPKVRFLRPLVNSSTNAETKSAPAKIESESTIEPESTTEGAKS
jgi:urea transport system permease protein